MAKYMAQNPVAIQEYGKHNNNNMEYGATMSAKRDQMI